MHRTFFYFDADDRGKSSTEVFRSDNCPSWWPEDVMFIPLSGSPKAHAEPT